MNALNGAEHLQKEGIIVGKAGGNRFSTENACLPIKHTHSCVIPYANELPSKQIAVCTLARSRLSPVQRSTLQFVRTCVHKVVAAAMHSFVRAFAAAASYRALSNFHLFSASS